MFCFLFTFFHTYDVQADAINYKIGYSDEIMNDTALDEKSKKVSMNRTLCFAWCLLLPTDNVRREEY